MQYTHGVIVVPNVVREIGVDRGSALVKHGGDEERMAPQELAADCAGVNIRGESLLHYN